MHQELVQPIKERIALGHTKAAIKKEVTGFGYSDAEFEEAYAAAMGSAVGRAKAPAPSARVATDAPARSKETQKPHASLMKPLIFTGVALVLIALLGGGLYGARAYLMDAPVTDPFADGAFEAWRENIDDATIINLVRPSVVRILTHFVGTTTLQRFDVDLNSLKLTPEAGNPEPVERTFDTYVFGSGFFVSENGRIVTNAHVVFPAGEREAFFDELFQGEVVEEFQRDPNFDLEAFLTRMDELSMDDDGSLNHETLRFMISNSDIEYEATVSILDPNGEGDSFNELMAESVPARVIALEEDYELEDKDVAVIEISETDLPALRIEEDHPVTVGDSVYVFGYPGSSDISNADATESSFTTGVVNAVKDAPFGDFKLIQTDAKISGGSSGGPMVNDKGEVIGLVTLTSGSYYGDNFGFAVPVSVLKDLDGYVDGEDTQGHQHESILKGLFLMEEKHCELANEYFTRGLAANQTFNNTAFVQGKIDACASMIASGESIDTRYEQLMSNYKTSEMLTLIALGGILLVLFVIVVGLVLVVLRNRRSIEENRRTIQDHHPN